MPQHDIRFTAKKAARLLALIEPLVIRRREPLAPLEFLPLDSPLDTPDPLALAHRPGKWQAVPPYTTWGLPSLSFVMRGRFIVPHCFVADEPVSLLLPLGESGDFSHPEALVAIDGVWYATADRHHQEFPLTPAHCDGDIHELLLHGWTGLLGELSGDRTRQLMMRECAVVQVDAPTRAFHTLAQVAMEGANLLDELEPARARLYNALDSAMRLLDTRDPLGDAFYASVPAALDALREGVMQAGPPRDAEIVAAGHAHIDVAWLWTLGQTRRKAGRTFYNALRLMDEFPDFHFTQSQPQLYEYTAQDYPEALEGIRQRVREGRWEPIGGMWVEADCNLSGAESLARQFLLGRTWFREQFGHDAESPVLWLPDVFGYAWNLPQLIRLAGLEYFFTIKIGWNQYNKMPFDSFWWQGLDGTRVLTHFSTAPEHPWQGGPDAAALMNSATYNADLTAFTALGSWAKLQHKEAQRVMLMSYGYGDGGGGPTRQMNRNAGVLRDFPALPRVTQGRVIDFFRRLDLESAAQLPVWNAELYLELHRGTYTTQSRNKRANRKSEFRLHDAEFLAVAASLLDASSAYPQAAFRDAWKVVCLNQFHDIIPGSSIGAVYAESQAQYAELAGRVQSLQDESLACIRRMADGDMLLVNPTSFRRDDLAFWPGPILPDKTLWRSDSPVRVQLVEGGALLDAGELAPYSVLPLRWAKGAAEPAVEAAWQVGDHLLDNGLVRVELDDAGDIRRIYDYEAGREALSPEAVANQWQAFEDRPLNWDAWDIDIFYDDKQYLADPAHSIRLIERGPLRATIEIRRRILNSTYVQTVSLQHNRRQIDFETTVDWQERHILLKTAFPVDILSPVATHEVQWGHVQRPTHRNTSWDWARFETCAQKWVDLSEGGYGVALLNDCKYGHDIQGSVIRLSLLRSSTNPDTHADEGIHTFAYSLLLHGGSTQAGVDYPAIAARAYQLNDPLLAVAGSGQPPLQPLSLFSVTGSAIIETIKGAEDGRGVIVRLYEGGRQRGPVTLTAHKPLRRAWVTNLLEDDQEAVAVSGRELTFMLRPFQIVTLRLLFD